MLAFIDFDKQSSEMYMTEDIEIIHPQKVKCFLNKSLKTNTGKLRKNKIKKSVEQRKEYIQNVSKEIHETREKGVSREEQRINRQIFLMTQNEGENTNLVKVKGSRSLFKINKRFSEQFEGIRELLSAQPRREGAELFEAVRGVSQKEMPEFLSENFELFDAK